MRNSGIFMWGFMPRIIVGLVLAITVCTNAKAGARAVLCADQQKCFDEVNAEDGSCNYYTLGMAKETIEGCKKGSWYCSDSADGECVTYSCNSCTDEKTFQPLSVNKQIVGKALCKYALYDGDSRLPTNGDACTNVSGTSPCEENFYLVGGECLECPYRAICPGGYESYYCPAGYYAVDGGCKACSGGTTSPEGAESEDECVSTDIECAAECPSTEWTEAPSGYPYMETRCVITSESSSCESRCAAGSYDIDGGASSSFEKNCSECPPNSTSYAGATDVSECFCNESYYGIAGIGDGCQLCPPSYCDAEDPIYGSVLGYPSCLDYNPEDIENDPHIQGASYAGTNYITKCFIPKGTGLGDATGTFTYDYDCFFTE